MNTNNTSTPVTFDVRLGEEILAQVELRLPWLSPFIRALRVSTKQNKKKRTRVKGKSNKDDRETLSVEPREVKTVWFQVEQLSYGPSIYAGPFTSLGDALTKPLGKRKSPGVLYVSLIPRPPGIPDCIETHIGLHWRPEIQKWERYEHKAQPRAWGRVATDRFLDWILAARSSSELNQRNLEWNRRTSRATKGARQEASSKKLYNLAVGYLTDHYRPASPRIQRHGPLTFAERYVIDAHLNYSGRQPRPSLNTPENLAVILNRPVETVITYIKKRERNFNYTVGSRQRA